MSNLNFCLIIFVLKEGQIKFNEILYINKDFDKDKVSPQFYKLTLLQVFRLTFSSIFLVYSLNFHIQALVLVKVRLLTNKSSF